MKKRIVRRLRSAVAALLAVSVISLSAAVFADETSSPAADMSNGEYVAGYVEQIVEFLSLYAKPGVTQATLYEAALTEILKQHPEYYEMIMEAMLSSIDEHSEYYKSGEFGEFISQLESEVGGIGITFFEDGENLIVGTVIEDSPAERIGIQPGDILYSADGTILIGAGINAAQNCIRGEVGTQVVIGVLRGGSSDPVYYTITRETVDTRSSLSYSIIDGTDEDDPNTARRLMYIRITSFIDNTAEEFGKAVAEADAENISDIIIDVRDNGGGYLSQAAEVANYFVPAGSVIVSEDHKADLFDVVYKSDNTRTAENNVVVLVNGNSASASEILAAAIQENGVGVVIGTQTYGKGTVQSMSAVEGGVMKYTSAYYLTPNGNNIDGTGVTPDAVVENEARPFDYSGYEDFDYSGVYERGMSDGNVAKAKKILNVWGLYGGDLNDPYFDSALETLIAQFQLSMGLFPYGVLDITTQTALYRELTNTVVEYDTQFDAALSHFGIALSEAE
ncbi:MAG TPA: PDZ domain-containing protein [Candidatus Monoglobus merdigallinarum]|uniref:PDZ domain-containing protein n=1 Tax=Candidatus Monoglobus merdigallinarum TaxID=2838698 RepID=A0A9D1TMH9_9FIRM|nr:PDZ domain-containing protein [Candidatus Monoglobus merdigallinarum]